MQHYVYHNLPSIMDKDLILLPFLFKKDTCASKCRLNKNVQSESTDACFFITLFGYAHVHKLKQAILFKTSSTFIFLIPLRMLASISKNDLQALKAWYSKHYVIKNTMCSWTSTQAQPFHDLFKSLNTQIIFRWRASYQCPASLISEQNSSSTCILIYER